MNPLKVYFGFCEQSPRRVGFSYVVENLTGRPMGGNSSITRSTKGAVKRVLVGLITQNGENEITHIGIYTKNQEIINYLSAIKDGSLNTKFSRIITKRGIRLIVQNEPQSNTFQVVEKNAADEIYSNKCTSC